MKARLVKTKAGWLYFVLTEKGLLKRCTLPFTTQAAAKEAWQAEFPEVSLDGDIGNELAADLQSYFNGDAVRFRVRLDESGLTEFQRSVYRALRRVRPGKTVSYGELAEIAGRPKAARGVGVCMRKNPFPPIVPCHRVLGASGALTGFSSERGLDQKRDMLLMEGADFAGKG